MPGGEFDSENQMQARVRQFEETVELCMQHQHELDLAKAAIKEKDVTLEQERYLAKWYEDQSSEKYREAQILLKTANTLSTEKEILLAKLAHQFHINTSNESVTQKAVPKVVDKEESQKLESVAKDNSEQLKKYSVGLTNNLKQSSGAMREIPSRMQHNNKNSFSVKKMIAQHSENHLQVIDRKATLLDNVFMEYKNQVETYKTHVPKLAEEYRFKTEDFFVETVKIIRRSDETVKAVMRESNIKTRGELDLIKKSITRRHLQDEQSLRELESLIAATKNRLKENTLILKQVEGMEKHIMLTEERATQHMLENIGHLEQLAMDSIKTVWESNGSSV